MNLFLKVLEAGKPKIKVLADSVSGETASWFTESHLLGMSLQTKEERDFSGAPVIRTPIPFTRAPC